MDRQSARTGRAAMFALLLLCPLGIVTGLCQTRTKQPAKTAATTTKKTPPNYTSEPYVYQSVLTQASFARDGTLTQDTRARIKVQSQAGVQNLSILNFLYASATSTVQIEEVQVTKPDGSIVQTPPDSAQDMPAPITRQAPFYSDLREKQVAVKGLEAGDLLTYEYKIRRKPLTPHAVWFNFDFVHRGIALRERLDLSVPASQPLIVASGKLEPQVTAMGGRRVYVWTTSRLRHNTGSAVDKARLLLDSPPADVEASSFQSWVEVGQWFRHLAAPEAVPTATIEAKAAELTKGMTSEQEKVRAIYDFVSLRFRYVGVAFGIGRYRPHPAAVVLSNEYGDCKDKETLLAALLAAVGVKAYPALINSTHKVVPGMPSPGQFDHVVAAVPQGSGYLWLDTTDEVGPPGYLLPNLRDKMALVIPDNGPAQLIKTPADPPFSKLDTFTVKGKLDGVGTLDASIEASFRGDTEVIFRLALRALGQEHWDQLVQAISYRWGFAGKVSQVMPTQVDSTASTLGISYDYTRQSYSSWSNGQIVMPEPSAFQLNVSALPKAPKEPIPLGAPGKMEYRASIALPPGYTAQLPHPVNLVEDFAEYHSSYSDANGVLRCDRLLELKQDKLAISQVAAYKKFAKAVNADVLAYVDLQNEGKVSAETKAQKLFRQGLKAWRQRELAAAATLFQKASAADANYGPAWTGLGAVHVEQGDEDQGLSEMKKAIAVDPEEPYGYEMLASKQMSSGHMRQALATWEQLQKIDPTNRDAPGYIGSLLLTEGDYVAALPELQKAVQSDPTNARAFWGLGYAELEEKHPDKALAAYKQAIHLDPSPRALNSIAGALSNANVHLHTAQEYAERAVKQLEDGAKTVSLDSAGAQDLMNAMKMGMAWDSLGWTDFRLGQLVAAKGYLLASWQVSQIPSAAYGLARLFETEGHPGEARRYYSYALASWQLESSALDRGFAGGERKLIEHNSQRAMQRLTALLKSSSRANAAVQDAGPALSRLRTIRLPKLRHWTGTTQVTLLVGEPGKVLAVKPAGAQPIPQAAMKALLAMKPLMIFPDENGEKIVRRGVLDCEPEMPSCDLILMTPDTALGMN